MEPVVTPLVSQIRLTLRDLIGVMRKDIVHSTAVNIQIFAQMLHADAGALNMPARIANTPWTVPFQLLILELRLGKPENKVCLIALVLILLNVITHANLKILLILTGENIVLFKLTGIEINIAACDICIFLLQQHLDHMDKFRNTVGCRLYNLRNLDI